MDWQQQPDPLALRRDMTPPETARANAALRDYALMGAGRDIRSLHKKYLEQMSWWKEQRGVQQPASGALAQKPSTDKLNTLFTWSDTYEWMERVKRWDALQARREEEAFQADRAKWRGFRMDSAKGMFKLTARAMEILQGNMQPKEGPDHVVYPPKEQPKLREVSSALGEVLGILRREFGDEVDKVDITSGGKAIAITEVRVHLNEGEK